jgi:gamma-glutamyltranspeptidase
MDDFSSPGLVNSFGFVPSEANFIRAKKRPLSSMSPLIIVNEEDKVVLVLGASGGSKIVTAIAQVILKEKIKTRVLQGFKFK